MRGLRQLSPFALSLALHGGVGAAVVVNAAILPKMPADRWAGSNSLTVDLVATPLMAAAAPILAELPTAALTPVELPTAAPIPIPVATLAAHPKAPPAEVQQRDRAPSSQATGVATPTPVNATTAEVGPFGGQDLPPGVRSLAGAVTRALPKAAELDPIWFKLPLGNQGELRIRFVTDAEGRLLSSKVLDPPVPPGALGAVLERMFLFLQKGRFAVDPAHLSAGVQIMKISLYLEQHSANDNELAQPQHTFVLHQEAPTQSKPGKAYVTFNSGRHVQFSIQLE